MSQRTETLQRLLILSQQLDQQNRILEVITSEITNEKNESHKKYLWVQQGIIKDKRDEHENELTLLSMEYFRSNKGITAHSNF